jgi:NAD-dependent dihydropyrimidine dehydrogenase PreA subunit
MDDHWLPQIDRKRCSPDRCGGGACVRHCPADIIALIEGKAVLTNPERCLYCADCETFCPLNAITLPYMIQFAQPITGNEGDHHEGTTR